MRNVDTTANEAGSITFISGESIIELSFDEITALEHHEFKATEDTSSSGPASRKYKGVLLKDVLNKASINNEAIAASSKIIIKGLDGYVIAMSTDEVLSDKGVYLAFEKNGKPLGNMKNGGSGPFQLIAISDSFSQRWCKYVFEVSLE
jgi:DMSO/TMAO reductase YedYZ molybdopterin-dependent catalytic subunit